MNMQQVAEAKKLLAEIEMKAKRVEMLIKTLEPEGSDKSSWADKEFIDFEDAIASLGEEGVLDKILGSGSIDARTMDFCNGLKEGIRKYKTLTANQKSALSKVYWHTFLKDK